MLKKNITDYDFPKDLYELPQSELDLLSYEIRDFLIHSIAETGGHLAPNLGVVELSIALHRVFDASRDRIIWDVGHQSYVHKILTGRAAQFDSLRSYGGMSGFPKTSESETDAYNSGHSSSSISAAMGYAEARDILGQDHNVVAVIGDGAMTGGLAYEGLNNAGSLKTRMIVILNDNEMSISPNTGSISHHLRKLRSSQGYLDMKKSLGKTLPRIPAVGEPLYRGMNRMRDVLRSSVITESIFEDLGFTYYGPIDGHNIDELIQFFELAKTLKGPVLIHALTRKGKGYRNAELKPDKFHGIGPFDSETGRERCQSEGKSWSAAAGEHMLALAEKDSSTVCITAAMTDGVGLSDFAKAFPKRFFDTGIAEQHAVTSAAGLALGGLHPFVFCYSSFLQRAYDQILMDVALQDLPVTFMVDRAGCVGQDGETHHGLFDLSYFGHMPNMTVLAPSCEERLKEVIDFAAERNSGPVAIRYPRGKMRSLASIMPDHPLGFRKLRDGDDIAILAVGPMVFEAVEAADLLTKQNIHAEVIDVVQVKPLDVLSLAHIFEGGRPVLTVEDNVRAGGFGESVAAAMGEGFGSHNNLLYILSWPDEFLTHGDSAMLAHEAGLDAEGIAAIAESLVQKSLVNEN